MVVSVVVVAVVKVVAKKTNNYFYHIHSLISITLIGIHRKSSFNYPSYYT